MASLPPIDVPTGATGDRALRRAGGRRAGCRAVRLSAAPRRRLADPRPAAGRMVRACAGARGRPQPRQPRARPDRAGDASARTRRATATSSPSTATCSISAIACWSSSPTATSRGRSRGTCCSRPGSTCFRAADAVERPLPRRVRGQGGQGSRLSPRAGVRMGRSGSATAPRRARGAWPKGSTGAGASCPNCSRSTRRCRR